MINERCLTSGHRCPMMDGRRSRSLIISYFAIRTIIHSRYLQPVTDKSSVIIPESQHVCVCSRERKGLGRGRGQEENCALPHVPYVSLLSVKISSPRRIRFHKQFYKFSTSPTNSSELRAIKNSLNLFSARNFFWIAKKRLKSVDCSRHGFT